MTIEERIIRIKDIRMRTDAQRMNIEYLDLSEFVNKKSKKPLSDMDYYLKKCVLAGILDDKPTFRRCRDRFYNARNSVMFFNELN